MKIILIKITIVLPSSYQYFFNIKLKLPRYQVHITSPIMFFQLFSRTGQFLPLPLALPVVNLFGQCQCHRHSGSRCSKRIVIVNQSRRICHFLTLWPQLLRRFGNRWRFASTVTWCPLLAHCRIFLKEHVLESMAMPMRRCPHCRRTSTCRTMKVYHHVLIASWLVTCFVKFDVFPPLIFETFLA